MGGYRESHIRRSVGTLKNCLVGRWEECPDACLSVKEVESWAKVVWRLKGGLRVGFLNNELLNFEFEDAARGKICVGRGLPNVSGRKTESRKMEPRFRVCEKKKLVG